MKRLPIGISDFKTMIEGEYAYVDKTKEIYELISRQRPYFLSRPRRFGKSVLISTLKELFSGNKRLFAGTWISKESNYQWVKYPVIHLDFSTLSFETSKEFKNDFIWDLENIAKEYGVHISRAPSFKTKLKSLIIELSKKNKVVVLIDEYDNPILSSLSNKQTAADIHKTIKSFFMVIKALNEHLQAVFITGVTKFSKTSIFSGMNNLDDISMDPRASTLLGYTAEEIALNFDDYIEKFSSKKKISKKKIYDQMLYWYNGYQFSSENVKVYNPFSVLQCLDKNEFKNYWFETGTPSFLIELIKKQYRYLEDVEHVELSSQSLGTFELDELPLIPILFQTGYLTIREYDEKTDTYKLGYPNYEVAQSFKMYLMISLTQKSRSGVEQTLFKIKNSLDENDIDSFCTNLKSLLANIPYQLHIKNEAYYHSLFQLLVNLIGLEGQSEVSSSNGRIDMVIGLQKRIIIFEMKFKGASKRALSQIKKKRYYEKYIHLKKLITLVGLSFNYRNKMLSLDWIKKDI